MSNEAKQHPEVWDWRTFILKHGPNSSTYRHVLLTLSCYMDSAGDSCFPSYDTLEEATCLSRPSLSKYLNKADEDGWIERTKHGYGGKSWARNEYRARVPDDVLEAVKQVNYEGSKGSKPDEGRQLNSQGKAVKQVNSTSLCTSSNNSPGETPAREGDGYADVWEEVTGERPNINALENLQAAFGHDDAPEFHEKVFRKVLREAWINCDREAYRIKIGRLVSDYERKLEFADDVVDDPIGLNLPEDQQHKASDFEHIQRLLPDE